MEKIIIDSNLRFGTDRYEGSGRWAFNRWPNQIFHYSPEGKLIVSFRIKE
jgi:hypothetical protein